MPVASSTRSHLDDHLSQEEFALNVAANFDCLKGTPAHEAVRAALARVAEARGWVKEKLVVQSFAVKPAEFALQSVAGRMRTVHRRMSRLGL